MSLENNIKDVITKKLEDGTVEKLICEQLEKGVVNALENMFRSYGDVTKVIEDKVKSVMVPYLESYDYSKYITKLDSVLVDVLKNSALDNTKLLDNFKTLMTTNESKTIKLSELFEKWLKHVAEKVETDGLEIDYDDSPSYYPVDVSMRVEEDEGRSWSSFEYSTVIFECEHDEDMNFEIKISKYTGSKSDGWDIRYDKAPDIKSLRYLDSFEVFLMNLTQSGVELILDTDFEEDEVRPEKEPEANFS